MVLQFETTNSVDAARLVVNEPLHFICHSFDDSRTRSNVFVVKSVNLNVTRYHRNE